MSIPHEFRLDVFTAGEQMPLALHYFTATSTDMALDRARALLACDGPHDRYGELYQRRTGDIAEYVDVVDPAQPAGQQ